VVVPQRGGWGIARFFVLLGSAAAALAGCAAGTETPAPSAAVSVHQPSPPASLPTLPAAAGSSFPRLPGSATAASLVGLSASELSAALGPPRWRRAERPAQVWQYQGATCVLDVYLYEEQGAPRVVFAEARDESALPVTLAACLQRIEAERRSPAPAS
jgi:hypothetical protein